MNVEDNTSDSSVNSNSEVLTSEAALRKVGSSVLITSIQDFMPVLICIDAGQDIILRLTSFCQTCNQVIYILSAVGDVNHPSIHLFNHHLTFEGRCSILSLRGFLYPISTHGVNTSTVGVVLMMSGADCHPIGRRASYSLVAASPIMVVVAVCTPTAPLLRTLDLVSATTQAPHESEDDGNDTPALSSTSNDK